MARCHRDISDGSGASRTSYILNDDSWLCIADLPNFGRRHRDLDFRITLIGSDSISLQEDLESREDGVDPRDWSPARVK